MRHPRTESDGRSVGRYSYTMSVLDLHQQVIHFRITCKLGQVCKNIVPMVPLLGLMVIQEFRRQFEVLMGFVCLC